MITRTTLAASALTLSLFLPCLQADPSTETASQVADFVSGYSTVIDLDHSSDGGIKVRAAVSDFSLMGECLSRGCTSFDGKIYASGNELTFTIAGRPVTVSHLQGSELETAAPDQPANTYELWAANFSESELGDPAADLDGDGLCNLVEYALGLDPSSPSKTPAATIETDRPGGQRLLTLRYALDSSRVDVRVEVQVSTDLSAGSWTNAGVEDDLLSNDGRFEHRVAKTPLNRDRQFLRLAVRR